MVEVEIVESLFQQLEAIFKKEARRVYRLMKSLKTNPRREETIGTVAGIPIMQIR